MQDTSFLIEGASFSRHSIESQLVLQYALKHDIPVTYASLRQVRTGRVNVRPRQVPVGGIPFVRAVAQQLCVLNLEQNCYPVELQPSLHRTLNKVPLRSVLAQLEAGGPSLFIKPAERTKRFTGFVLDNPADYRIAGVSRSLPVWTSNPVSWLSEWRAYVVQHKVQHLAFYAGSRLAAPSHKALEHMVETLATAGGPPGYALDLGVLASPDGPITALVEVNDGFSVGAYENTPTDVYAEMLSSFWHWVCHQHNSAR